MSATVSEPSRAALAVVRPSVRWRVEGFRLGVALLAALAAIVLRLPELDRYATIDESRWVGRSADFVSYIQERDLDETYIVGHPGVTTMWLGALAMGPERVHAFSYLDGQTDVTRRDGYLDALVAARRGPLVANGLALGLLVWLAWGLLGPGAALLGGLLLLLDPFLGAHSRLIHLDALLASFMAVGALASLAFWRGGAWGYAVLAGLASGLAFLTKAPSVYLLAFVPGLALVEHVRTGRWRRPGGWGRLVLGLALWLGLAWLVCLALWPALRLKPLAVLRQMVDFTLKNGGGERDNYFLGQPVDDPGPLFYPLALLFRATPLMLLSLALLVYLVIRHRRRLAACWPALLLGGYAAGFLIMMTLGEKKFDRYELPVFPALDILAGLGLWYSLSRWERVGVRGGGRTPPPDRTSPPAPLSGTARGSLASPGLRPSPARGGAGGGVRSLLLAALLLAAATWPLASVYPYYLAYYNPLLGGGAAARWALFVGWGEGLDRVAEYVNDKPLVLQAPTVASAYHRALQAHLRGNNAMPLERAELADYIVPYVNSIQRDQDADLLAPYLAGQEPEYVVWLNGIEYARVYRGPHLPVDREIGADFGGRLRLESAVFAPGSGQARAGDDLLLRLRWRPGGPVDSLTSAARLVDPGGRAVLQARQPLGQALREGELAIVDAQLHLPKDLAPGQYRLEVGVEDAGPGGAAPSSGGPGAATIQTMTIQPAVGR